MAGQERSSVSERTHVLSVGGTIAPISYTTVVIVLGLLWPSYSHVTQAISELGGVGAPNAIVMNTAGFALAGILIVAFALGLHYGLNKGRGSKIGPALVAVYGLGMFGIAFFPWDVTNLSSFTSTMHSLIGWPHWIGLTLSARASSYRLSASTILEFGCCSSSYMSSDLCHCSRILQSARGLRRKITRSQSHR